MKKLASAPTPAASRAEGPGRPSRAPDAQDRLGNAALSESLTRGDGIHRGLDGPVDENAGDYEVLDYWNEEERPWDVELDPAVEEEKAAPVDPASRPARFKKGLSGALIGDGKDIALLSDASEGASTVATVSDGKACKVIEYTTTHVKVEVRVGKEKKQGWVSAQLFSDQPKLAKDEDNPGLQEDLEYNLIEGDLSPEPGQAPTAQGGLGDCFLIASLAAIHFANPDFTDGMITYDAKTKRYTVRFHEEVGRGRFEPVDIVVDGFLPTPENDPTDPSYAGDPGSPLWGAIAEKAYAKWKGGYDVLGEGGSGAEAMQDITGVRSQSRSPSSMSEKDVLPYFEKAKADGLAVYGGVVDQVEEAKQTPFSGSGPYTGTLKQQHDWNEVQHGTVSIRDTGKGKSGEAWDTGSEGDKTAKLEGTHVDEGEIDYKASKLELGYVEGKGPEDAKDLEVKFASHGVVLPSKMLIGNHAYVFRDIVDGDKLQFYNPWGSYQPKPITAAEFLEYFDSLASNTVPKGKTAE